MFQQPNKPTDRDKKVALAFIIGIALILFLGHIFYDQLPTKPRSRNGRSILYFMEEVYKGNLAYITAIVMGLAAYIWLHNAAKGKDADLIKADFLAYLYSKKPVRIFLVCLVLIFVILRIRLMIKN